jgi:hypothetical protein
MKRFYFSSILSLALLATPFLVMAEQDKDALNHRISLYLWGAGMSGHMGNAAAGAPVDISFEDILDNLEAGLMANYRLKGGKWAFNFDYIYLNLTPTSDVPPANVDLKQSIVELSAGYEIQPELEVVAGIRYVDIDMKATVNITPTPPTITGADDWVDPIVGLDYRRALSDKWRFYGRADIGGFGVGSDLTWQLAGYFGYMPSDSWNLYAGYRHLDFDYKSDNDKKFFYDITLSGPLIGFGYHF